MYWSMITIKEQLDFNDQNRVYEFNVSELVTSCWISCSKQFVPDAELTELPVAWKSNTYI